MNDIKIAALKASQQPRPVLPFSVASERFWQPQVDLRGEVDRVLDNLRRGFDGGLLRRGEMAAPCRSDMQFTAVEPAVDVVESDEEFRIIAELPGLGPEDVELSLSGKMLVIKGEKKEQHEEKATNYSLSECRFGTFRRVFELPRSVKQ
ncbi:Hsp20/alpha crystallin family protein [Roseomonas marmotae]|uniref:Hsp20/alpha crystallin family protein n=1 Tax=Roseomonas marmotae TaxID=2768161 RepID=A0ABS3KI54_9PROT|nr:Hsp20/alpha crystallin family protein [Roseomonas marmotae]MBO1077146.1 Hsp20/alpha crystallin family protein [Roseomonas marmotae]QTI81824.1 Hsp20/alpha crystallin family protein [Roseomonas marmotae]